MRRRAGELYVRHNMNREEIIAQAYKAFGEFDKPIHSTNYQHCEECNEYDELLRDVKRANLSVEQIGTVCWGPVAFLLPEAMAYYMPRFIELAVENADNKENDPYIVQFINQIGLNRNRESFSLFREIHVSLVFQALTYINENYREIVEYECWEDELDKSIIEWSA